ncbi:hypothetical protein KY289_024244 [Solanum tuberosum]|nr:hypothetical protein KY289_024244 [Solanum tuberosum]
MRIHSHPSSSSTEGEQSRQVRSSDEDDITFISSDSNYIGSSNKGTRKVVGLGFETRRINSKGGVLADDMGMGKTVQAIALVLAKLVTVIQWINEIDRFTTKASNTILVYYGASREKNIGRFAEYDFVITTYSTVETEYRKNMMILHSINLNRIILDEAHCVKDIHNNTTRAILALESSYKWALSVTPLQNCVGELYSLVGFLQIIPYSYYFCEECDCRALDNRQT